MPSIRGLTLALALSLSAVGVSSCANRVTTSQQFPSAADVLPPQKPRLSVDALTSATAGEEYDSAVEAWGDALWLQVARNCRVFARLGMKIACPAPGTTANDQVRP